jgi:hypothetical protein
VAGGPLVVGPVARGEVELAVITDSPLWFSNPITP